MNPDVPVCDVNGRPYISEETTGTIQEFAFAGASSYGAAFRGHIRTFGSFKALKNALGRAGKGRVWHHIVEQREVNIERFGAHQIHSTGNVVNVSCEVNQKIADYYSRKRDFAGGRRVREWLTNQSFEDQWEFGMMILELVRQGKPLP